MNCFLLRQYVFITHVTLRVQKDDVPINIMVPNCCITITKK